MPIFSYRRILSKQMAIFNKTGRPLTVWTNPAPPQKTGDYVPGQLFKSDQDVSETTLVKMYLFGKFEETDVMESGDGGRERKVLGIITVPMLFRSQLAKAEYVDPYNDGSRFRKAGVIVDEGKLFATVQIESISLANKGDV